MPDDIVIPGGFDEWSGHRVDDFVVGAEHTVFEWCMIYTGGHPTAFLGDNARTASVRFQDIRLTLLGARGSNEPQWRPHPTETNQGVWDDPTTYRTRNAVYQELAEGTRTGRFDAQRVYLDDQPSELDPTLCIIGRDPVLAIARRRNDFSQYIAALLARADAVAATVAERTAEATASKTASIEHLAEWIFARHGTGKTFEKLYDEACGDSEIGGFKKADFQIAYRLVYDTKRHRPPVTGWPLKSPYKERHQTL
jgi:hypothetical protein